MTQGAVEIENVCLDPQNLSVEEFSGDIITSGTNRITIESSSTNNLSSNTGLGMKLIPKYTISELKKISPNAVKPPPKRPPNQFAPNLPFSPVVL